MQQTDNTLIVSNMNKSDLVAAYKGVSKVQQTDNTLTVDSMNEIYLLVVGAY